MNHSLFRLLSFWLVVACCSCNQPQSSPSIKASEWTKDSTAHFQLSAQNGVRRENKLAATGRELEQVQKELLNLLNENTPQHLQVYFLKDRETLTSYTGFPANGYADTEKGILYFVDKAPFRLAFRHETMHVLSWRLWGPPRGYWLSEGIAVFASGHCGGYSLHSLAQIIEKEGKLASFENLTDTFDFKAVEPSLQSASMVKYIHDNYGVAKLKEFWKAGLQDAQRIIGVSPAELQKRWLDYIRRSEFQTAVKWDNIHKSGCE